MTDDMSNSKENSKSDLKDSSVLESIPVANVRPARSVFQASYMWLLTLGCLALAIGLVWASLPEVGHQITIHFPEGHGLEAEDKVRYRGIDVGTVERVSLNGELSGVDVSVVLAPFAEPLAREGTRFWIVRPELSLSRISGIETAVGHKYIGLQPSDPNGTRQQKFAGLAFSPPDALNDPGFEIVLRGIRKHSVNRGSPVTCRGVEVGQVISVGLSQDARHVDIRVRIQQKHADLISTNSVFWATSGIDLDISLSSGLKLNAESLETIARGGVSLLTIAGEGKPIQPGHIFNLYQKAEDDWYEKAATVRSTSIKLHGAIPLETNWKQKSILGTSSRSNTFAGLPISSGDGSYLLCPADVLVPPKRATEGSFQIVLLTDKSTPLDLSKLSVTNETQLAKLPIARSQIKNWLAAEQIRQLEQVEDCLAVRATPQESGELTYLHYPIEATQLSSDWEVRGFNGDRKVWHGAPVLSAADGMVVGVLLVGKRESRIVPITPSANMLEQPADGGVSE